MWGQFPSTSPRFDLYLEGRFNRGFFTLRVWGAYIWRGLFSEFHGIVSEMGSIVQHEKEFWILFGFLSEEQNLCSPIRGKREFYHLKGRVAACYGSLMWSSSTRLLSLTSLKPVWRHRNRGCRRNQTEDWKRKIFTCLWYFVDPRSLYNNAPF